MQALNYILQQNSTASKNARAAKKTSVWKQQCICYSCAGGGTPNDMPFWNECSCKFLRAWQRRGPALHCDNCKPSHIAVRLNSVAALQLLQQHGLLVDANLYITAADCNAVEALQ